MTEDQQQQPAGDGRLAAADCLLDQIGKWHDNLHLKVLKTEVKNKALLMGYVSWGIICVNFVVVHCPGHQNAQHWWVATQDKFLRSKLDKVRNSCFLRLKIYLQI